MALSGKRQLQGVAGLEVFIQEALTATQRAQRRKWLLISATYQAVRATQRPMSWRKGVPYYWTAGAPLAPMQDDSPPAGAELS